MEIQAFVSAGGIAEVYHPRHAADRTVSIKTLPGSLVVDAYRSTVRLKERAMEPTVFRPQKDLPRYVEYFWTWRAVKTMQS